MKVTSRNQAIGRCTPGLKITTYMQPSMRKPSDAAA